jgi:DNA-directed RNA polymerase subunit delta
MKRVIVDYAKLTNEILTLLVDKFPDGYEDSDIIRFKNAKNETIEAVEVKTEDTIYLVKVSMKLSDRIVNYDEDEENDLVVDEDGLDALKELEIDEDDASDEELLEKSVKIDDDLDPEDIDEDEPSDEEENDDDEDEED